MCRWEEQIIPLVLLSNKLDSLAAMHFSRWTALSWMCEIPELSRRRRSSFKCCKIVRGFLDRPGKHWEHLHRRFDIMLMIQYKHVRNVKQRWMSQTIKWRGECSRFGMYRKSPVFRIWNVSQVSKSQSINHEVHQWTHHPLTIPIPISNAPLLQTTTILWMNLAMILWNITPGPSYRQKRVPTPQFPLLLVQI